MDYSETVVTLMITVMASAAAFRSTTAIADARDTARACLEGLRQPAVAPDAIEVAVHDGGRHAPRMRTLDLSTGTGGLRLAHGQPPRLHHDGHPPGLRRQDRERLPCRVASPLKQPDGR
ncbi:hypothetical protein ACFW20_15315 [Streptomyces nigra]|uniref:hypothetical protein n=1 Tax=Streptomyces nigra TaxID=1827580 RepID=UPI0030CF514F